MNNKEFCQQHPNKTIQIYCLNVTCNADAKCCIVCLQQYHSECKEQFLLGKDELNDKLLLQHKTQNNEETIEKLNKLIQQQAIEVRQTLQEAKKSFLLSLQQSALKKQNITPEIIKSIKRNHSIKKQDNGKLKLISRYNSDKQEIDECMTIFDLLLKRKIQDFAQQFSKVSLMQCNSLLVDDFIHHPSINLSEQNNSLLFKRIDTDNAFNYYCALYKEPINQQFTIKISIVEVYPNDRYVDIGIVTKSKFIQLENGFINTYNSGGISFCGYSVSGGLTGKYPTKSSGDAKGLKPGQEYYMQYLPGQYLKFWDNDDQIDLKKLMTQNQEQYYLFCTVYHPQTKFTIEKLD